MGRSTDPSNILYELPAFCLPFFSRLLTSFFFLYDPLSFLPRLLIVVTIIILLPACWVVMLWHIHSFRLRTSCFSSQCVRRFSTSLARNRRQRAEDGRQKTWCWYDGNRQLDFGIIGEGPSSTETWNDTRTIYLKTRSSIDYHLLC